MYLRLLIAHEKNGWRFLRIRHTLFQSRGSQGDAVNSPLRLLDDLLLHMREPAHCPLLALVPGACQILRKTKCRHGSARRL